MGGFFGSLGKLFAGTPEKRENVSTLRPEQEGLYNNLINAGKGVGAGGAFGQASDYYRDLLSDDSQDYNAFAAPQLRQYNEQIVPGLAEQFAGMGAGGLNSSGFRNAQMQGATDLAERLGAIRANLRQAGAQGLQNIGNLGLGNYSQNMTTEQGTPGLLEMAAPLIGIAGGAALGGAPGAAGGKSLGDLFSNWLGSKRNSGNNSVGANSSAYQSSNIAASPSVGPRLPTFLQGMGRGY